MTGNAEKMSIEGLGAEAQTWRELLQRCIPIMYGMYVRRGFHPALAEELVQQTVFDAVRGWAGVGVRASINSSALADTPARRDL